MANTNIYNIDAVTTTSPIPISGLLDPNNYTITSITSIPEITTSFLDNTAFFPSTYKLVITPNPGINILAREFKINNNTTPTRLSYNGETNSHTEWPSKFQWQMESLGTLDPNTPSGLVEFPTFYKVVFQDSKNRNNDPAWILNQNPGNQVFVWIYFGKNEVTPVDSLVDLSVSIDIDRQEIDPLTEADTLDPTNLPSGGPLTIINSFNI